MGRKRKPRTDGDASGGGSVKMTVVMPADLYVRLGVAASVRRMTRSALVAEVLGPYLARWRMPSQPGAEAKIDDRGEDAA